MTDKTIFYIVLIIASLILSIAKIIINYRNNDWFNKD